MFSVNTNNGAFVALQNLSITNKSISEVQNRINTGLKVSSAKDDSATYAIAQNLRGDVAGINAVRTSLDRAKSSLDVAIQASEAISDLLNRAREISVAASDLGLDSNSRTALNNDFKALVNQIGSVVNQAEFNGTNLIKASPDSISAITSVKQNSTVDRIAVAGKDLNTNGADATFTVASGWTVGVAAGAKLSDVIGVGGYEAVNIANTLNDLANVTLNDDGSLTVVTGATSGTAAGGVTFTTGSQTLSIAVGATTFTATLLLHAEAAGFHQQCRWFGGEQLGGHAQPGSDRPHQGDRPYVCNGCCGWLPRPRIGAVGFFRFGFAPDRHPAGLCPQDFGLD
jgi:flagellin